MITCHHCGEEVTASIKVCPNCGRIPATGKPPTTRRPANETELAERIGAAVVGELKRRGFSVGLSFGFGLWASFILFNLALGVLGLALFCGLSVLGISLL